MEKGKFLIAFSIVASLLVVGISTLAAGPGEVPRMTKEELRSLLGNPDVIIFDVRTGASWAENKLKIKGAVREDPKEANSWAPKYPKEKTLVFYCS